MIENIFILVFIYFFIGAIGIFFINRKTNDVKLRIDRWLKYFIYFIIVNTIICTLICADGFQYIAGIICSLGLIELIKVWKEAGFKKKYFFSISCIIYVLLSCGFINYSFLNDKRILLVYVLVFGFDGFSQIIGQLTGKHKVVPSISPNKTLEGLLGGFVTTVCTSLMLCGWFNLSFIGSALFAAYICCFAFIGDIVASYYKRIYGVKDYSNIIPGHGGVLDRFDSFIMAGFGYILLYLAENLFFIS